jgi:uncharacterized protein
MSVLLEKIMEAWKKKNGPSVFSTVDKDGIPNAIYVTCISLYNSETILIADNYLHKTKQNVLNGSYGSLLFITDDHISFQIKGSLEYHSEGILFEDMKKWNPEQHPGHAVVALKVEHAYSGSEKLL